VSHHKHYTDADRARRRGSSRENAIRTRHRCDNGTGNRNGESASSPRRSCRFAEALFDMGARAKVENSSCAIPNS